MLRKMFVLTEQGYKDFIKGALASALANLVLMAPVVVFYLVIQEFLNHLNNPSLDLPHMVPYLFGIIISLVLMYITQYWAYVDTYSVVYNESARKRLDIAEHLRLIPLSFFGKRDIADLTSVIMKDAADQERLFSHVMPQLFGTVISTLVFAAMLSVYNWKLALAALWPIPVTIIGLLLTARFQNKYSHNRNTASLTLNDELQEFIECQKELRSLNGVDEYQEKIKKSIKRYEQLKFKAETAMGIPVVSAQSFLRLGIASTILVGVSLLTTHEIDLLVFICFMLVITRIYDPVSLVLQSTAELIDMRLSLNRMRAIEEEKIQTGAKEFSPENHDLVFNDVHFSYENGIKVLNGVSFVAKSGEVTALVGPSGSGKSTAAKLAARFWDTDKGTVAVGGIDISTIDPETLLTDYSEVFQDVILFDGTIKENIRLGKKDASDEEVYRAAQAANCDEFVLKYENGYDTIIGENGSKLSGGERQRISIARAILKDAPIVLLDEATASLDVENETKVQAALSKLLKGKTVLVIAHRMRTVDNADKIIVFDQGRVVEQGSPQKLKNDITSRYHNIYELQMGSSKWAI